MKLALCLAAALVAAARADAQLVVKSAPPVAVFLSAAPAVRAVPVVAPALLLPASPSVVPLAASPLAVSVPSPAAPAALESVRSLAAPSEGPRRASDPGSVFDGARVRSEPTVAAFDAVPPAERRSVLMRLAAPFRTDRQLARLGERPRAQSERFRFAVVGDAEPGRFWVSRALFNPDTSVFWRLLARADRAGADFILQIGDMVSRGHARNFLNFFARLRGMALTTPYLTVIGNHDRKNPHGISNDHVYRGVFGGTEYAFDRGGWRFVVVDTSDGRLTPERLARLDRLLVKGQPTIVFTHMPPAPLREWTDWGRLEGAGGFKEGSDEFMRLMSERGVKRVYMGHVHGFGVLDRGGVRYVLTGGGGSPLFPGPVKDRFHHYIVAEAGPDGLVEIVHRADGTSFVLQ